MQAYDLAMYYAKLAEYKQSKRINDGLKPVIEGVLGGNVALIDANVRILKELLKYPFYLIKLSRAWSRKDYESIRLLLNVAMETVASNLASEGAFKHHNY